ncbi:hypothetical protein GCM10009122_16000 [Fulvivirga kasyanovii]|uniref:DUF6794 domain-containing protein n=1 Tax=Fulvivirga kasyanovii TaxID=396812 RepID=A0ABW9RHR9_9BACT|nr:DUF6794 domain-containing protein [Fulvivirga kasyanovii]MTI23503.1 hypothetical protein [Fulvivirga kasyanovii]
MMISRIMLIVITYMVIFQMGCSHRVTQSEVAAMDTIHGVYIPADLDEAMAELDKVLSDEDKEEFKALKSRNEMLAYHHGLGMWMRNSWALWGGSRLAVYFHSKGITHPEGMSSEILMSYYDWLHRELILIDCITYKIEIPFFDDYTYQEDSYTEGIFHHYIFEDHSTITVHCGFNVKRPFNTDQPGDTLNINGYKVIRYVGNKEERLFIEDYYIKSEITIIAEYLEKDSPVVQAVDNVTISKKN